MDTQLQSEALNLTAKNVNISKGGAFANQSLIQTQTLQLEKLAFLQVMEVASNNMMRVSVTGPMQQWDASGGVIQYDLLYKILVVPIKIKIYSYFE